MTSMGQFKGMHWLFFGVPLFALGVLTIFAFFVATIWTGNVRLLAGVGAGVLLLLGGLVLMSS